MPHAGELSDLLGRTQPQTAIAVGASPFTYVAPDNGTVFVQGGYMQSVEIGRNGTFTLAGSLRGAYAVQRGDQVRVTYGTWWPVMSFMKG